MKFKHWSLKKKALVVCLMFIVLFLGVVFSKTPTNERDWALDQKILPTSIIKGDEISISDIRNFSYRSTTDYTPAYYDKTFKLSELESVDFIVEPFDNLGAAHTFLSFGFASGDYVAISVEIRKEVRESFSAVKGLLNEYELTYVIADERDVIKLRTNYRKDNVYLYPIKTTKEKMQKLFVDMINRSNKLNAEPEFYNTLTNTCTTNIVDYVNAISVNKIPYDWRFLLPEYADELAYEIGLIDNSVPLAELRQKHQINALAEQYADSEDFSKKIRGK